MMRVLSVLWLGLGILLEKRNNPRLAAFCISSAVEAHGNAPATWHWRLAQLEQSQLRFAESIKPLREAMRKEAHQEQYCLALGRAYLETAAFTQARQLFEEWVTAGRASTALLNAYGNSLLAVQEPSLALEVFERVITQVPHHPKANSNRVAALLNLKRPAQAEAHARAALELPGAELAVLQMNLGTALIQQEKRRDALDHLRRAVELDPTLDEARYRLAMFLGSRMLVAQSLNYLERRVKKEGPNRELEERLALAYLCSEDFDASEKLCLKILETYGDSGQALLTLSNISEFRSDLPGALAYLERSLAAKPDAPTVYSNILFLKQSLPETAAEELFARHCAWWTYFREKFTVNAFTHSPHDDPERKIKLGYVSGDFVMHPVGNLLNAAFKFRNRDAFEIHCFSNVEQPDGVTDTLRAAADYWHDLTSLSQAEIAELIHSCGIDILVDLTGHTDRNCLPAFGRRPAPVQVSWLGYFHSTGLGCMDYFISDPHTTPPDSSQRFCETLVHLPHTRFCLVPHWNLPDVTETPALTRGYVTFGSFNRLNKLTPEVMQVWARILALVPDSKLIIKASGLQDEAICANWWAQFADFGIAQDRIDLRPFTLYYDSLGEYADVDIALDPFPFGGGMTTFDALGMGVPVVTLAGQSIVTRQSAAILANIDLPDLAFDSVEAYIAGAVKLAQDVEGLAHLRAGMRERMRTSPIGDGARFARDLESLYRRMWEARCKAAKLPSDLLGVPEPSAEALAHFVEQTDPLQPQSGMQVFRSAGTPEVAFVICSIDDAKINRLTNEIAGHFAHTPYELVSIRDARSLSEAYNRGADQCRAPYVVFCHDDIHLLDPHFWIKLRGHLEEFDLVGPAGSSRLVDAQWSGAGHPYLHGQLAHPDTEMPYGVNIFDGGAAASEGRKIDGNIQALDGVFLALRRSVLEKIRYDEVNFDGFHCYDIDFSFRAFLAGFKLGATYDIAIYHESAGNFGATWKRYADRFMGKHGSLLAAAPKQMQSAGQFLRYASLDGVRKAFELEIRRANQEAMKNKYGSSLVISESGDGKAPGATDEPISLWKTLLGGLFGRDRRQ